MIWRNIDLWSVRQTGSPRRVRPVADMLPVSFPQWIGPSGGERVANPLGAQATSLCSNSARPAFVL